MSPRETPRTRYLANCPRFVYGTGGDLRLSLPSQPRDYTLVGVGGDIESDAGVRTAFIVRRDKLWTITLRFYESEWPNVQAFISAVQPGDLFTYYPDTAILTSHQVRLVEPAIGRTYDVTPDPNFPIVFMLTITVQAGAIAAPSETGDFLPSGYVFDYEADDAIYIETHFVFTPIPMECDYPGVVSVTSKIPGGLPLTILGARPGYYPDNPELNGHALIRAFGSSNNNPMLAELDGPEAANGATLIAVHRPGNSVGHGYPFQINDGVSLGEFPSGVLMALGCTSGIGTIGGWRRGPAVDETGEYAEGNGGTYFFEPENYPSRGVPFHWGAPEDHFQEFFPVSVEDNEPGDPFNISIIRITAGGQVSVYSNGVRLPFVFTAPAGPYLLKSLLVTSSAGGSLDLSGGQSWEWARVIAYPRALTNLECVTATRVLGLRYGTEVA